ncbi:transposase [bacterium]|nr:transposase [bacterium]
MRRRTATGSGRWWRWAYIGRLYQVEKRGREDGLSPADLCALRRQESAPILSDLHAWLQAQAQAVLPQAPMGEAIGYALGTMDGLDALPGGRGPGDRQQRRGNALLRQVALGRKTLVVCGR